LDGLVGTKRRILTADSVEEFVLAGDNEAHWLTRTGQGWQPAGATKRVTGVAACLTPNGSRALLLGQRPAVLDHDGNQRSLTDLDSAGACAWARSGGIVAELSVTGDGQPSRVRVVNGKDVVRWQQDMAGQVRVTADPTGSRVAYQADRVLHEIDTERGVELRAIPGVQAARYDANGDLVTIADDGTVSWRR